MTDKAINVKEKENSNIMSKPKADTAFKIMLIITIVLQLAVALCFCMQKQGFHYDENYSYYSSNVTYGLNPPDGDWLSGSTIAEEFCITPGKGFNFPLVAQMQSFDVHPPVYYFLLNIICSLSSGIFSKWQGLILNLIFFVTSELLIIAIANKVGNKNKAITWFSLALFGFSPAIISGITFIRMYMLLTSECMALILLHMNMLTDIKNSSSLSRFVKYLIQIAVTVYIGFLTHYYFAVFAFFVAAFTTLYLFFSKNTRKTSYIYAITVIGSLLSAVLSYPASLRHIFRGYRGTEAMGAFFDMNNLSDRMGLFVGLIDDYVLNRTFYILLLIILLAYVQVRFMNKRVSPNLCFGLSFITAVGYFAIVMKTALMNYEEAVRYEMPIYGLLIILIVVSLYSLIINTSPVTEGNSRGGQVQRLLFGVILAITLVMQLKGLYDGKVLFLYPEEKNEKEFATEHKDDVIIYVYDNDNKWKMWDNAHELEQYNRIYCIEMNHEGGIDNRELLEAKHAYAYVMRYDAGKQLIHRFITDNPNLHTAVLIEERGFADIYELR
ncbi:hypothetical protein [Lacrimispora saccharolytica]|uniref:hypothetical protein n=1 Tax=Lacrimispora saccharolytica TaxID=84030 RepID=UPI00265CF475|nr:hypothetical protein [Lacrimispora saccharolytica]MCF2657241.1 hypothetical protein [Lacrimispora saccharolytica]